MIEHLLQWRVFDIPDWNVIEHHASLGFTSILVVVEWYGAIERHVEDDQTGRPDVDLPAIPMLACHCNKLRRPVSWCAYHVVELHRLDIIVGRQSVSQTKVAEYKMSSRVKQHVFRFDIAVYDTA